VSFHFVSNVWWQSTTIIHMAHTQLIQYQPWHLGINCTLSNCDVCLPPVEYHSKSPLLKFTPRWTPPYEVQLTLLSSHIKSLYPTLFPWLLGSKEHGRQLKYAQADFFILLHNVKWQCRRPAKIHNTHHWCNAHISSSMDWIIVTTLMNSKANKTQIVTQKCEFVLPLFHN
jgi:hypothetical protein